MKDDIVLSGRIDNNKLTLRRKELLELFIKQNEGEILLAIRKKRKRRSLNQNAYLWAIYTQIGLEIGLHKEEVHAMFGNMYRKEHTETTVHSTGEVIRIDYIRSTTSYNKAEFGEYIDKVLQWAAQNGMIVMTPQEYYATEIFTN